MKNFENAFEQKLIYIFEIPDAAHRGLLKIGETTIKNLPLTKKNLELAARKRIAEYTRTAGIFYHLRHVELAVSDDGKTFRDHDVHDVLINSNVKKVKVAGTAAREWFKVKLGDAVSAIKAVKLGRKNLSGMATAEIFPEIIFRDEQEEAVARTVEFFKTGKNFLWNAKMRFGKTLCALEVVRRMNFSKTLILSHRPVVDAGWYDDFKKIFRAPTNFIYRNKGTKIKGVKEKIVYFVSMQDLRGSESVGGKFDKNDEIFKTAWDFVIVDEAHEGTQTELGDAVIKKVVKKNSKVLALSGTPFNLLDDFTEENTYTWSYVDEQRAKAKYDAAGDFNPYADLPAMKIYTYNLGEHFNYDGLSEIFFNFGKFFETDGENFVREADVKNFLDLLTSAKNYPFSRPQWRKNFRHTFWIIPGVKEGHALSKLLKRHKIFSGFEIVNVAGSEESDPVKTLQKVQDAIAANDFTITLSCGKLTTGVTVPEWTAVFYLAGGSTAQKYLQTIFRVQSPCVKGGFVKKFCYVFDFAPDRTLKMLADYEKVSARPGTADDADRQKIGELLNFCPVISVRGSEMESFDANKLFTRLKRVYVERTVRRGFDDNYLYSDELLKIDGFELDNFKTLKGIMGASKAQPKTADLVINALGFDEEEREKISKDKKIRTPEEKDLDRRKELKRKAISVLRGISIRMPLLIYGADVPLEKDFTIDMFLDDEIIDEASWTEFMPAGVTKKFFRNFIKYYDQDVFVAAGKRIRQIAKAADKLSPTARVKKIAELFDTFKNPDKETVLTPWRVVQLHLAAAFDENFFNADKKILEINSKTGLYALAVVQKIFLAQKGNLLDEADALRLWDEIVAENIFVICKTPMAKKIARRSLVGFRGSRINAHCFDDLINLLKFKSEKFVERVKNKNFWSKGVGEMFFHAVVGNPPYQNVMANTSDEPVYHLFLDAAFKLADKVSLVHPARCLFNAGKTPKEFNQRLLNDPHVRVVKYFPKSQEIFPYSDIKGGVVITLRDAEKNFGAIDTFTEFDELNSIFQKVVLRNKNFKPLSKIIRGQMTYKLSAQAYKDFPDLTERVSERSDTALRTNAFEIMPDVFLEVKPDDGRDYIQILGRLENRRVYKFVRREYMEDIPELNKWKVFIPASNGSGAIGEVLSTPLVGLPLVGCTQTFITIGAFDTAQEAQSCLAYIKSKFARAMLGILKVTQHNPPSTWSKVPLEDFSSAGDIDWGGNVDEQLYRKYNLSAAEIKFIEEHVRAMT